MTAAIQYLRVPPSPRKAVVAVQYGRFVQGLAKAGVSGRTAVKIPAVCGAFSPWSGANEKVS
ncbi:MAG: hypothetical protein BJ554DRAFT_1209, partial [Olpidium bornovanus]